MGRLLCVERGELKLKCPRAAIKVLFFPSMLPCDGEAYASLLTEHTRGADSTFLSRASNEKKALMRHQLLELVLVLVRSLRRVEAVRCRRDFVLLLGDGFPLDGASDTRGRPSWPRMRPRLEAEGVKLRRVAPLVAGVPSADKLAAFNLTQYLRILVLDADVMVLRSLEPLFARARSSTTPIFAHHPYDMVQGMCGVRLERRIQGSLMLVTPSAHILSALLARLRTAPFGNNSWHLRHYSEQTVVACHFLAENAPAAVPTLASPSSSRAAITLPCRTLFDLGGPTASGCLTNRFSAVGDSCLLVHHANCLSHGPSNVERACLLSPPSACAPLAGEAVCEAISAHLRDACTWPRGQGLPPDAESMSAHRARIDRSVGRINAATPSAVSSSLSLVRAVHFKGSIKPWRGGGTARRGATSWRHCQPVETGALVFAADNVSLSGPASAWSTAAGSGARSGRGRARRAPLAVVPWDEPLQWNATAGRCVSAASAGRVVAWPNGRPLEFASRRRDERLCCTFLTLLTSWWNEILHPRQWRPLPPPLLDE